MQEGNRYAAGVNDDLAVASWQALAAVRNDVIRSLCRRGLTTNDAEDHVHDAVLRLGARGLTDLEPARVRGLLIRAAWAIAIDHQRRSDRHRRLLPRLLDAAVAESADEIVAEHSEARWLAASLAGLGAMERNALMHAAAGRGVEEIAALLSVDYKAAANALARARRKLRLLATSVSIWLAGLLRRLRHADQGAALTASAVTLALLMLGPSHSDAARAAAPPPPPAGLSVLRPDRVQLVAHQVVAAPAPPSQSAPRRTPPTARSGGARPAPAPQPPSPSPPPSILPPWPLPHEPSDKPNTLCPVGRTCSYLPGTPAQPVVGTVLWAAKGGDGMAGRIVNGG